MTERRFHPLALLAVLIACLALPPAHAQLRIEITSGVTDPIPIAIVPFARTAPTDGGLDVAQVIQADLEGSGRFKAMARADMISRPTRASEVVVPDWRTARNDYIVVGRVLPGDAGATQIEVELVSLVNGQRLAGQRFVAARGSVREAAHRISDLIYEKILGVPGAFATRVAYISVEGTPPSQTYRLVVADADGEGARTILESRLPIMSPTWSPDGESLAYVTFEHKVAAIYTQNVRTGERRRVSARPGVNGSPSYSPDGSKLALTLTSGTGNLDVYTLELASGKLTRLTDDSAIDTEATFSPDGKSIYFTSDRAGNPQIYQVDATGGAARRVTYNGSYNARPQVSPSGKELAMVTLSDRAYRIAVQDLASGTVRVLSKGKLDESPSYAPNGALIIHAGREGGRGVLETVSVDGLTARRLQADSGDVREPAWGPQRP